jgi:hypothetical protein
MPEGLSPVEVGNELAHHNAHAGHGGDMSPHDRRMSILEAILLAVVAVLAAWSGYASAKWGTESSLSLARATATRTEANSAHTGAMELRNFDSEAFNTWFIAYEAGDSNAMRLAERRFRPEFEVAFDAWLATEPLTNSDAPPGPTFMPEYEQSELERAEQLNAEADEHYRDGAEAGERSDDYVRITVFLAMVLFLVGISSHIRLRGARIGLVAFGVVMLAAGIVQLLLAPKPPTG